MKLAGARGRSAGLIGELLHGGCSKLARACSKTTFSTLPEPSRAFQSLPEARACLNKPSNVAGARGRSAGRSGELLRSCSRKLRAGPPDVPRVLGDHERLRQGSGVKGLRCRV